MLCFNDETARLGSSNKLTSKEGSGPRKCARNLSEEYLHLIIYRVGAVGTWYLGTIQEFSTRKSHHAKNTWESESVCACVCWVCAFVWACVWERERVRASERERERRACKCWRREKDKLWSWRRLEYIKFVHGIHHLGQVQNLNWSGSFFKQKVFLLCSNFTWSPKRLPKPLFQFCFLTGSNVGQRLNKVGTLRKHFNWREHSLMWETQ